VSARKQLEFAARAFQHIAAAEEFISRENPAAARKVAEAIYKTAEKLETFPDLGKPGRVPGTRELPLAKYPYTLVYRVRPSKVIVYAVMHQARKYS
jgi:plasmid stabilization system protein ParE